MNKNLIQVFWLFVSILVISCSKKVALLSTQEQYKLARQGYNNFLPAKVVKINDTTVFVTFAQTSVPYYLSLNSAKDDKSMRTLQDAHQNYKLVSIKTDPIDPHKIIEVNHCSAKLNRAFQKSLKSN